MRHVFGMTGGFFFVFILITMTNKPRVEKKVPGQFPVPAVSMAPDAAPARMPMDGRMRGFTLLAPDGRHFTGPETESSLRNIAATGVTWVALAPAIAQPSGTSAEVPLDATEALALDDLRGALRAAAAAGLQVMVAPVVALGDASRPDTLAPRDADTWLTSYGRAINPYLRLAEEEHAGIFCLAQSVGSVEGASGWPAFIENARKDYHGKLTYAADQGADAGYKQIAFWQQLDLVGIDMRLAEVRSEGTDATLDAGWTGVADGIEAWRRESGVEKPVLFTSVGTLGDDAELQSRAAASYFRTAWQRPWVAGTLWHTWMPARGQEESFAVLGRPAFESVRAGFEAPVKVIEAPTKVPDAPE